MMMKRSFADRLRIWLPLLLMAFGFRYILLICTAWMREMPFAQLLWERLTEPGDAPRYLDIALNGYVREGENAINLVFYPLYPLLTRGVSYLTGSLPLAGMALSHLCYAGAVIGLYELLRLDRPHEQAFFGTLLFILYPFSMFVLGVYSESLFLLLTVFCLYAVRKRRLPAAGVLGLLAALTRVQGMLLLIPALTEILLARFGLDKRKLRLSDASVLLIPVGFLIYLAINRHLYGNPFQFLVFEEGEPWYQTTKWLGDNLQTQWEFMRNVPQLAIIIYIPQIVLFFAALGALAFGLYRGEPLPLLMYGGAYLGFTYLSGWMISGGRYMLCCVPFFSSLSLIRGRGRHLALLTVAALLFTVYNMAFLIGYAIM